MKTIKSIEKSGYRMELRTKHSLSDRTLLIIWKGGEIVFNKFFKNYPLANDVYTLKQERLLADKELETC